MTDGCKAIPSYYFTRDEDGVPDGLRNLQSVKCSCCGENMLQVDYFQFPDYTGHVATYQCENHPDVTFTWTQHYLGSF